ncbi:MAG TPA: hypothetical protein VGI79_14430 [Caulobacteraceae bacterium]
MINRHLFNTNPGEQLKAGKQGLSLTCVTPALHQADIGEFEREQTRRQQAHTVELSRHGLAIRFAEQQRRLGRSVNDLRGGYGRLG